MGSAAKMEAGGARPETMGKVERAPHGNKVFV